MNEKNSSRFEDRVVVITGAGSGIGKATALAFTQESAQVVVVDIDKNTGTTVMQDIERSGGEGLFIRTDITKETEVRNMVNAVVQKLGKIDILVNNAGIHITGDVISTSLSTWEHLIAVNLTGSYLCAKYCISEMKKRSKGTVINVSSEAGIVGLKNQVAYNVSKTGLISLTKSMALDHAPDNIRVNCICPGRSLTPLVKTIIQDSEDPDKMLKMLSDDRPQKRMGKPEEIAAGILFLASQDASYATGSVLVIDGGYTTQ